MDNKNTIDEEYQKLIKSNPEMKYILYLRIHPHDEIEKDALRKLSKIYGDFKELNEERVAIFIVQGKSVNEFISELGSLNTQMYLSFIQREDELLNKNS